MGSTYAKRLTIDGFNIFQNIDAYPPVNAQQLITGINTWWKHIAPDYYGNQEGRSPLPLNLCLCWWARIINEAPANTATILGNKESVYRALGKIANPDVTTTFALNYYNFDRGEIRRSFDVDSKLYTTIKGEEAFREQFRISPSIDSFEEMVSDKKTGGTNYFFSELTSQIDDARSDSSKNRIQILNLNIEAIEEEMTNLLQSHDIFPPPKIRDARKEDLKAFRDGLKSIISDKGESEMKVINHALREFLDVNYQMLFPIPTEPLEINKDFLRSQFRHWVSGQLHRFKELSIGSGPHDPRWDQLGIETQDQCRNILNALAVSMEPEIEEMTQWLSRLCEYRNARRQLGNTDLRRHLAMRMANAVVTAHSRRLADLDDELFDPEEESQDISDRSGRSCYHYRVFIQPFLEEQLPALIGLPLSAVERPDDIPGEDELIALCKEYSMEPKRDGNHE